MKSIFFEVILGLVLGALVISGMNWAISADTQTNEKEAKSLAKSCKPISRSVIANPTLSREPLSLYLCKDGGIEYQYVTTQKIK